MDKRVVSESTGWTAGAAPRRALLLDTAATLFRKRGFNGVGIDDIGGALGLTGPAVFHYFPGKRALLAAIVDRQLCAFEDVVADIAEDVLPREAVGRLVRVGLSTPDSLAVCLRNLQHLESTTRTSFEKRLYSVATALARHGPRHNRIHLRSRAAAGVIISLGIAHHPARLDRHSLATNITLQLLDITLPERSERQARGQRQDLQYRAARAFRTEAILAAAAWLFKEYGFNGVSLKDIGAAAGVSGSAVSRRFMSKEQLLTALFARLGDHIGSAFYIALAEAADTGEALKGMLKAYVSGAVGGRDLMCLNLSETYHLPLKAFQARRKRQRAYARELVYLILQLHPGTSEAEANARARAALVVVSEIVNANRLAARQGLAEDLTSVVLATACPPPGP
jgi:AcrR family transcriptional regulator